MCKYSHRCGQRMCECGQRVGTKLRFKFETKTGSKSVIITETEVMGNQYKP